MIRQSILFFCLIILTACSEEIPPQLVELEGAAQGTTYHIKFWNSDSDTPVDKQLIHQQIENEFKRIDKLISNYRDDSDIEAFNQYVGNKPFVIDSEITDLLRLAKEVYRDSQGCFDPTIAPLFKLWGFKDNQFTLPDDESITNVLEKVGFNGLSIESGKIIRLQNLQTSVDLSGIGQGYSVAKIATILESAGFHNYLVEIGGEMLVKGHKPDNSDWKIAIERPTPNSNKIHKVITLKDGKATAIMTSGTYRHYFADNGKQYSHVIDPRSGYPIQHSTVSVTTLLENPTLADAWSTALLCLGSDEGLKIANQYQIPALFIDLQNENLIEKRSDTISNGKSWEIN